MKLLVYNHTCFFKKKGKGKKNHDVNEVICKLKCSLTHFACAFLFLSLSLKCVLSLSIESMASKRTFFLLSFPLSLFLKVTTKKK